MFTSRTLRLQRLVWTAFRIAIVVFVIAASPARSQSQLSKPTNSPKYDLGTETKIKGTVEDLRLTGPAGKAQIANLVLKQTGGSVDVFLCPKAFLVELGVSYAKGDELEITGSKVKRGDIEEILARQIVKKDDILVLRDKTGKPVW
jgi:hypothetical protein